MTDLPPVDCANLNDGWTSDADDYAARVDKNTSRWSIEQTDALVNAWRENVDELDTYVDHETWCKILRLVNKRGSIKTILQVKKKLRNLKDRYKLLRSQNRGFSVRHLLKYNKIFDNVSASKTDDLRIGNAFTVCVQDPATTPKESTRPCRQELAVSSVNNEVLEKSNQSRENNEENCIISAPLSSLLDRPELASQTETLALPHNHTENTASVSNILPQEARYEENTFASTSFGGSVAVLEKTNVEASGTKHMTDYGIGDSNGKIDSEMPQFMQHQESVVGSSEDECQTLTGFIGTKKTKLKSKKCRKRKLNTTSQLIAVLKTMQKQQEALTKQFLEGMQKIEEESRKHTERMLLKVADIIVNGKGSKAREEEDGITENQ